MKKEVKILVALLILVVVGVAVAARLYSASQPPPPSARTESGAGSASGSGYGMNFREELIRPDSHARGPENAPLTVVEYLDPECESCRAFHPIMKQFLAENEGKVRFVVRYMAFHTSSRMAIAAIESAGLQGRSWDMLDILFEMADEWSHKPEPVPAYFEKYADRIGLDMAKFKESFVDQKWLALADRDMADGKILGVKGTPTVFVNGDQLRDLSPSGLRSKAQEVLGSTVK